MLKFIKNLSMLSTTLESLHSADAIDFLIDVLSHSVRKGQKHFREISNQVLNTMFNLCRLSKQRQEYAASSGIIPLLLKIMKTDHPPKEFVLPILCDMAHSGSKGRRYLWQNNGLDFYVSLLADQYWQVSALDAIHVWLQEETAKVERHLLDGNFTKAITSCFNTTRTNAFDPNLLEPLLKVLRLSPSVAASLAKSEMYAGIGQKLGHKKAVVRLNLLRVVRDIMDGVESDPNAASAIDTSSAGKQPWALLDAIQTLALEDSAVLVRNLASELVRSHKSSKAGSGERSRSAQRRTTSYTPPGLHSSVSMPPTPTPAQQHPNPHPHPQPRHRPSRSSAFIEVASTPKRSALGLAHDRDAVLYRPRSRDGGGATSIPRRVSGDATGSTPTSTLASASNGPMTSKSRLPRTSTPLARPSLSSTAPSRPVVARRGSASSNKENVGRVRSDTATQNPGYLGSAGASPDMTGPGSRGTRESLSRETSVSIGNSKRRNRSPGSDVRWS
jgi:hypothetical protein